MKPYINGIGTAIGSDTGDTNEKLDIAKIAERFGKPLRRVQRLGIERLHRYSKEETLEGKAVEAVMRALVNSGLSPSGISGIYSCVATPVEGYLMPGLARIIGKKLGLEKIQMINVGVGCVGGIQALQSAFDRFPKRPENYLVVAGDNTSRVLDENDWETAPLFSEGASAVVIGPKTSKSLYEVSDVEVSALDGDIDSMKLSGSDFERQRFKMKGEDVFNFATREAIPEVFRLLGLQKLPENAYLIPHQASLIISQHIAGRNDIPREQIYTNGIRLGNLTCSSVFFGLEDVVKNRWAPGKDVILAAFGAELAVGAAYLKNLN